MIAARDELVTDLALMFEQRDVDFEVEVMFTWDS